MTRVAKNISDLDLGTPSKHKPTHEHFSNINTSRFLLPCLAFLFLCLVGCSFLRGHPTSVNTNESVQRIKEHISYFTSPQLEGRLSGSTGEIKAAEYIQERFREIGLKPYPYLNQKDKGPSEHLRGFSFFSGAKTDSKNNLQIEFKKSTSAPKINTLSLEKDWVPSALSRSGRFNRAPVVMAGFGISVPDRDKLDYDSYAQLDVKGKWVLILERAPKNLHDNQRTTIERYSSLREKVNNAQAKEALGIILVKTGSPQQANQPLNLAFHGIVSQSQIGVLIISESVAEKLLASSGKILKEVRGIIDSGQNLPGFVLADTYVTAEVSLNLERKTAYNVLGALPSPNPCELVVLGSHFDHLGKGQHPASLAQDIAAQTLNPGADDNASGTSVLLEVAHNLSRLYKGGWIKPKRDILFAAWSGEELGYLGSSAFLEDVPFLPAATVGGAKCKPRIIAKINLDMVGRLHQPLQVLGSGSSKQWKEMLERSNKGLDYKLTFEESPDDATDAWSFYKHGIPVISFFTGEHKDYHTPSDTADKLNYEGMHQISRLTLETALHLLEADNQLTFSVYKKPIEYLKKPVDVQGLTVHLGAIPDIRSESDHGVRILKVSPGSPAARSGLMANDIVVKLGNRSVKNISDYMAALKQLTPGTPTAIELIRGVSLIGRSITPEKRKQGKGDEENT